MSPRTEQTSDLYDAISEGMQIIEKAMKASIQRPPRPLQYYMRPGEWNQLHIELAKRESPLHKYIAMDAEGRLMCYGIELVPLRCIPDRGPT